MRRNRKILFIIIFFTVLLTGCTNGGEAVVYEGKITNKYVMEGGTYNTTTWIPANGAMIPITNTHRNPNKNILVINEEEYRVDKKVFDELKVGETIRYNKYKYRNELTNISVVSDEELGENKETVNSPPGHKK